MQMQFVRNARLSILRHDLSATLFELKFEDELTLDVLLNDLPNNTPHKKKIYDAVHDYICDILRLRGLQ